MRLFPDFGALNSYQRQRAYVVNEMITLCEAKTFSITECKQYGDPIWTLVCEVILGHTYDADGVSEKGAPLPQVIKDYRIRIKAIEHAVVIEQRGSDGRMSSTQKWEIEPITFANGSRRVLERQWMEKSEALLAEGVGVSHEDRYEKDIIETGKTEIDLPIDQALYCLKEQGKDVCPAESTRLKDAYWKVREVLPSEIKNQKTQTQKSRKL